MATNNVNFKIKNGLVVEGSTATVNGYDILTKSQEGQDYIIDLIGGETLITSVDAADFTVTDGELTIASGSDLARSGDITTAIEGLTANDIEEDPLQATNIYFTDARAKSSAMDILVNSNQSNISITYNNASDGLIITAENGVADSDTDDLTEGTNNLYFTDARAQGAFSAGSYIGISQGTIDVNVAQGSGLGSIQGYLGIDRTTVDTWYEAAGAVSTHNNLTTGVHGVTGDVVGTTDDQDLSNKRIIDTLYFTDGVTISDEGQIAVLSPNHEFEIKANVGDLDLKTVAAPGGVGSNVNISSLYGDIILDANGGSYIGSAAAANEIATKSYVDATAQGLDVKASVTVASTGNVTLNPAPETIDGISLANGQRVLLKNQTTSSQNGIYSYDFSDFPAVLVRAEDADTTADLNKGAFTFVESGTANAGKGFVVTAAGTLGTDAITWAQFSESGTFITSVGSELDVTGGNLTVVTNTFDAYGSASAVAGDLSDHEDATEAHGATGAVVGTTNTQTLTNKTIGDTLNFTGAGDMTINSDSHIVLTPAAGSSVKWGSDVLATQAYVDTAVPDDTDGLTEGSSNLYYTDARVESVIDNSVLSNGTIFNAIESAVPDSTDSLSEGINNLYYTNTRAQTAAKNLLTSSNLTNITITDNGQGLDIVAENGVADSTTDDLDEGSTNLYFTDERAVDAIGGSNIQPLSIDINTYRKEEATQQYVASASTVTAHTFTGNRSVKYLVRTVGTVAGTLHSQITELLVTTDGNNNVAVTEYGTIYTSENPLSTATMEYSPLAGYMLRVTTAISGAEVVAAATIMSWAD